MYTLELDFGAGWVDYSSYLFGRNPIKRTRAVYNELKPVVSSCQFVLSRNVALVNALMTTAQDVPIRILKDLSAYFLGYVRPTLKTKVKASGGLESIVLEAVDIWYKLDQTVGTSRSYTNIQVSKPSDKPNSLLHQLFYDAGILDANLVLSEILAIVPTLTLTRGDGNYRTVVEQVIMESGYSAMVNVSGAIELYDTGPATILPLYTLSTGAGGNLSDEYELERHEATFEAVDIEYREVTTLSDVLLFEDSTGASADSNAYIPLGPGEYYPEGATATKSVDADIKIDGYEVIAASGISSDIETTGLVTEQLFVQSGLKISMRYYSSTGGTITRLRGYGDAVVQGDLRRVVRENVANTQKRDKVEFKYIRNEGGAQRAARIRAARYQYGAYIWSLRTTELGVDPGDYVTLSEAAVLGTSATLRVITVVDGPDQKLLYMECEGVTAYTETETNTESEIKTPGASSPLVEARQDALDAIADDGIITKYEKKYIQLRWGDIDGDGATTGSYWQTRKSALDSGVGSVSIDYAYGQLYGYLFTTPGVLLAITWYENVTVAQIFYDLWSMYYQAESQTQATISRWSSLGSIVMHDCGDYDPALEPDFAPELEMGFYSAYQGLESEEDEFDYGDYTAISATSETDCGTFETEIPYTELIDMGEFASDITSLYNAPQLILDCGDF
jgi:hypothetical protein